MSYLRAGLCVLPAIIAEKRPALSGWKQYQKRLPTERQVRTWFAEDVPLCVLAGSVSGQLEMIDFDHGGELFDHWREFVSTEAAGLVEKLLIERSQSGGRHVVYRSAVAIPGNRKLAQRTVIVPSAEPVVIAGKRYVPRKVGERYEVTCTLIETRGEGGLFLCAPSPGYQLEQGTFESLPVLTEAERTILIEAACALNEAIPPAERHRATSAANGRPGDDFNERGEVREVLRRHGWELVRGGENEHWRRPGKELGWSATLKDRVLFVFSSNATPFEPDRAYAPFTVYALLDHAGDFAAAAAALRLEGYGAADDPDVDLSRLVANGTAREEPARPTGVPDPGPFPDALLAVPGFMAEVMEYDLATSFRPQPVLALAGAISLQAVLAARKVRDERGNRTNLYLVGVAVSGGGKDHARKVNRNILFQAGLEGLEANEDVASDAGLITAVERQPGVLFQFDEFGRFLRTIGDPKRAPHLFNVLTALMKLYSSADTVFRGKAYADAKKNKTVDQPCVTVYGTTVPEHFYESLTADALQDGFVARLLVLEGSCHALRQRVPQQPLPESILDAARWWGEFTPGGNLRAEHPQPILVNYTPEAGGIFDAFAAQVDLELARDELEARSLWARAEEKACRLALVYACSANREAPVIDQAAAEWACAVCDYITRRMLFLASQWVADGQFDARQKKVVRVIRKAGGEISHSDLYLRTRSLAPRERQEVIDNLIETGQLERRVTPTATKPKVTYVLR